MQCTDTFFQKTKMKISFEFFLFFFLMFSLKTYTVGICKNYLSEAVLKVVGFGYKIRKLGIPL